MAVYVPPPIGPDSPTAPKPPRGVNKLTSFFPGLVSYEFYGAAGDLLEVRRVRVDLATPEYEAGLAAHLDALDPPPARAELKLLA